MKNHRCEISDRTAKSLKDMVARDGVERFRAACYQQLADSTMDTKDREDTKAISCVRFVCGRSGDEAEHGVECGRTGDRQDLHQSPFVRKAGRRSVCSRFSVVENAGNGRSVFLDKKSFDTLAWCLSARFVLPHRISLGSIFGPPG